MELAHQLSDLPSDVGVDIMLFDGEEFVFEQGRDDYFLARIISQKSTNPSLGCYVSGGCPVGHGQGSRVADLL